MKNAIKTLVLSMLAGVCIAIGGTVFLSCESKVAGAVFFATGLFFIVSYGLFLFTGKVGYLFDNKPKYLIDLLLIALGNLAGTFLTGTLLRCTRVAGISERAAQLCEAKLSDTPQSILILSVFCGMLMFLAVDGYRTIQHSPGKYLAVILPVAVFILCGFEHCVANMYYFSVAGAWSLKAAEYMLLMILGNSIGGVFIPLMMKLAKRIDIEK